MDSFYVEEFSVEDTRKELMQIVDFFRSQPYHEDAMRIIAQEERKLPKSIIDEAKVFFVSEDLVPADYPEWMRLPSYGFMTSYGECKYFGRLVYPVFDITGDVMGFCGWDKFAPDHGLPKYLDSKNYGYKAKETTLYGMEHIAKYYNDNKPVFVTEGIVDSLWLRSEDFHAMASLGSYLTPYVLQILSRFGNRLVIIPDNDEAGNTFVRQCKYNLPKARVLQAKVGKDVDGMRKYDDGIYLQRVLTDLRNCTNPFARMDMFIVR